MLGDQHASFIAGANKPDPDPVSFQLVVAEIDGAEPDTARHGPFEKIAAVGVEFIGDGVEILSSERLLVRE